MINTRFELYKLKRELRRSGSDFVFYMRAKNEFGAPAGDLVEVLKVRGLYHETNYYKTVTTYDGSTTVTEKTPMILCAVEDIKDANLAIGDFVEVDDNVFGDKKTMKFTGVTDILDFGIIADISLEVVDDGRSS